MEQELLSWLSGDNGALVHGAVFALLLLGGFGLPLPEDVPIIFAGVAAANGIVSLHAIAITCYVGVLIADNTVYWIGYFLGQRLLSAGAKSPLLPAITEERIEEIREGLRKRRFVYIFVGRHLFPVRSATFLTAGALHIPYLEFIVSDAIAALVSISIVMAIGYFLGARLTPEVIRHLVDQAHFYVGGIVLLCIAFYFVNRFRKQPHARR